MHFRALILSGVMVLSALVNVHAQENAVVYLHYIAPTELETTTEGFLGQLQVALSEQHVTLRQGRPPSHEVASLLLTFAASNTGTIRLSVNVETPQQFTLSPVLMPQVDFHYPTDFNTVRLNATGGDELAANFITATVLYALERCSEAETHFNALLQRAVGAHMKALLTFYQGNCSLLEGNIPGAIGRFESLHSEVDNPFLSMPLRVNLAWAYLQADRAADALMLVEHLAERAVGNSSRLLALTHRAQLYALAFRYDDAIADMDAAVALDPTNPALYMQRAQHTLLIYEWDRVLADYNRALELDPAFADVYFRRGILFYTQGPREDALTDFERYLALEPDGPYATEATQYVVEIQRELAALNK